ncbi:MAG TPA: hypothetical protein VF041_01865 [Gemmatimonadaceae bacterium]
MGRAFSLAAAAVVALSAGAAAQRARPAQRNVAKLLFDSGVIAVDARADSHIVIGAAVGDSTLVVPIPVSRAREWVDSASAILARRVRRSKHPRHYRSLMVDPDSGAGVSLTRHVVYGRSTYRLFFANTSFGGFPMGLSRREADLLVRAVRRAVTASRAMARAPADSGR